MRTYLLKPLTITALGTVILFSNISNADAATKITKVSQSVKMKNGKLVKKSTNKVVSGYVSYKGKIYKSGLLFTGTLAKTYYYKGLKANGLYNKKYYKKGKLTTGTHKGIYYKKGVAFTGFKNNKYYDKGKLARGIYKLKYYNQGVLATGYHKSKYYIDGLPLSGFKKNIFFVKGSKAHGVYNNIFYRDGLPRTATYEGVYYRVGKPYNGTTYDKVFVNGIIDQQKSIPLHFERYNENYLTLLEKKADLLTIANRANVNIDPALLTIPSITIPKHMYYTVSYDSMYDFIYSYKNLHDYSGSPLENIQLFSAPFVALMNQWLLTRQHDLLIDMKDVLTKTTPTTEMRTAISSTLMRIQEVNTAFMTTAPKQEAVELAAQKKQIEELLKLL